MTKPSSERWLFAVDPGKKTAGTALFVNKKLYRASLMRAADPLEVIEKCLIWAAMCGCPFEANQLTVDTLVTEGQQIYGGPQKADPNDLLPLSFVCGGIQSNVNAKTRLMPLPREWKGNVPKEIMTRRILSKLDKESLKIVEEVKAPQSLVHNVIDAIGLGLWGLGLDGRHDHAYKD